MIAQEAEKTENERSQNQKRQKKQKLWTVYYRDKEKKIHLTGYADTVVYDGESKGNTIVAIRFGGYPEHVQAIADAINGGGTIEIQREDKTFMFTGAAKNYKKTIIRNGPYAEASLSLKNSIVQEDTTDKKENSDSSKVAQTFYFLTEEGHTDQLFDKIDQVTSVPLIRDFQGYLISQLLEAGYLRKIEAASMRERFDAWRLKLEADDCNVVEIIEKGLAAGAISIPGMENADYSPFQEIESVSGYLNKMGVYIASGIKEKFNPLFDPSKEPVSIEILQINRNIKNNAGYSLYDAQLAVAEAMKRWLHKGKSTLCIAECGTGKSKIGLTTLAAYQKRKYKKAFNVVLCPSHLAKKWIREIEETVPNVFAVHIKSVTEFNKAYELFQQNSKNCYVIITKEKARDGYMSRPSVIWNERKKAFLCPRCYEPIMVDAFGEDGKYKEPAKPSFFKKHNSKNHKCEHCQSNLWSALAPEHQSPWVKISNYGFIHRKHAVTPFLKFKKQVIEEYAKSVRRKQQRFYDRQIKELTKQMAGQNQEEFSETVSEMQPALPQSLDEILKELASLNTKELETLIGFPKAYYDLKQVCENPTGNFVATGAYRRVALSTYIKKKHKHIDGLIADELQDYNNNSAQGEAMMELFGCAKKVVGLTGTLINGYAQGVFHLFYRVVPHLMQQDGIEYTGATEFNALYGVTESVYEAEEDEYNSNRRTIKKKLREKHLPGVSPLVYPKFLMESAVFLSLNDMGKDLPEYEEIPVELDLDPLVKAEYQRIEDTFIDVMKYDRKIAKKVMSAFVSLMTVYPDQPYHMQEIINPLNGGALIEPRDTSKPHVLSAKDQWVLAKVKEKVSQGGKVLVYTSWIGIDTQDKLMKLLKDNNIKAVVLKSTVSTDKREKWVADKVKSGVQVLVTNPSLVETGLDLNDFTTLIYYNISYKLFTLRQSSRRSWRINQTAPRIEVYFPFFSKVMQHRAIRLMASKLAVAGIIEGNFTDEGLSAMSECQDLTTLLAQELTTGIKNEVEDLGSLFKSMAILKPEGEENTDIYDTVDDEPADEEVQQDVQWSNEALQAKITQTASTQHEAQPTANRPAPRTLLEAFNNQIKPKTKTRSKVFVMENQISLDEIASA